MGRAWRSSTGFKLMVMAIAENWGRGGWRLGLLVGLGLAWPLTLRSQEPAPKASASPPASTRAEDSPRPPTNKNDPGGATEKGKTTETPADKAEESTTAPAETNPFGGTLYRDERAENLINKLGKFTPITSVIPSPGIADQIVAAAGGGGQVVGQNALDDFVRQQAAAMTSARVLSGLGSKEPADNQKAMRDLQKAYDALQAPVTRAMKANPRRPEFLKSYTAALLKVIDELLANHLHARLEGMLVLSRTGDPQAIPTYLKVLADPEQDVLVKQIAAYGITTVIRNSRTALPPDVAIRSAESLQNFLEAEPDALWTARFRALEAMGWLRQAGRDPSRDDFPMLATAAKILANPKEELGVRCWAAWAISMMRVDRANAKVDYSGIARDIAQLAVNLGEKILAVKSDQSSQQAVELITLLAWPLYNSLKGEPDQTRSGLINAAALGSAAPFAKGLEPLMQTLARSAVELSRASGAQLHKQRSQELTTSLAALKDYLAKNPPANLVKPADVATPKAAASPNVDATRAR